MNDLNLIKNIEKLPIDIKKIIRKYFIFINIYKNSTIINELKTFTKVITDIETYDGHDNCYECSLTSKTKKSYYNTYESLVVWYICKTCGNFHEDCSKMNDEEYIKYTKRQFCKHIGNLHNLNN